MIQVITFICVIFMTIITMEMEGITAFLRHHVPSAECPEFWTERDPEQEAYKKEALIDYYLPLEKQ